MAANLVLFDVKKLQKDYDLFKMPIWAAHPQSGRKAHAPILRLEIQEAIRARALLGPQEGPSWPTSRDGPLCYEHTCTLPWPRSVHIQKIAWLVVHGDFLEPAHAITVRSFDLKFKKGDWVDWNGEHQLWDRDSSIIIAIEGNHRFQAACYRKDQNILGRSRLARELEDCYRWTDGLT